MRAGRVAALVILWSGFVSGGALGETGGGCLSDAELGAVTRSVYTKSLGPAMRICATNYPRLEARALGATRDFFVNYNNDMRRNRLQTNQIFQRLFAGDWQANLAALLDEATGPILLRAGIFSAEQCTAEIKRLEVMVKRLDYGAIMSGGAALKLFRLEREHIPACAKK